MIHLLSWNTITAEPAPLPFTFGRSHASHICGEVELESRNWKALSQEASIVSGAVLSRSQYIRAAPAESIIGVVRLGVGAG